jgi:hypothetical protein
MTTITIKNGENLSQTFFNSTQDLFIYLRKELTPLKLYQIDESSLSKDSLEKVNKSINNPNKNLTDFQG